MTPPPASALRQAGELLEELDALHDGQLTEKGRRMLELPTHPRLAHMLIESQAQTRNALLPALAADVAALLDERDPLPREVGADLTLRVEALRHWRTSKGSLHDANTRALAQIGRIAQQWRQQLHAREDNAHFDPFDAGWLVAQAYPDRIAQARDAHVGQYKLANGRGARLAEGDPMQHEAWLAVAQLDAGSSEGRVFLAAPLHEEDLWPLSVERDVAGWESKPGALVARRERRVGQLVLEIKPISHPSAAQRAQVLCEVIRSEGLALLNWTDAARQWRRQQIHPPLRLFYSVWMQPVLRLQVRQPTVRFICAGCSKSAARPLYHASHKVVSNKSLSIFASFCKVSADHYNAALQCCLQKPSDCRFLRPLLQYGSWPN